MQRTKSLIGERCSVCGAPGAHLWPTFDAMVQQDLYCETHQAEAEKQFFEKFNHDY